MSDAGDIPTGNEVTDAFDVVANERRRTATRAIANGASDTNEVVDRVVVRECGEGYTSTDRKNVYVGMYQCHLPKMDQFGTIEYDKERGDIVRGPWFGDTVIAMEAVDAAEEGHWALRAAVWLRSVGL